MTVCALVWLLVIGGSWAGQLAAVDSTMMMQDADKAVESSLGRNDRKMRSYLLQMPARVDEAVPCPQYAALTLPACREVLRRSSSGRKACGCHVHNGSPQAVT